MLSATIGTAFPFNFITAKVQENCTAFTVVVSADNPVILPAKNIVYGINKWIPQNMSFLIAWRFCNLEIFPSHAMETSKNNV